MRVRAWTVFVVLFVLCAAALPPARADVSDEKGPNFAVPDDLAPEAKDQYKKALESFSPVRTAETGQTGLIAASIKEFKKAKDLAPKLAPSYYYLGLLYQYTKEFAKAREALEKACALNASFHQAVVELGDVYYWMKQPEKAIAQYDRAIAMKPDFVMAYIDRGFLHMKGGDFQAAVDDLDLAKKVGGPKIDERRAATIEWATALARRELDGPGWARTFTCETTHYKVMTPVDQALANDLGKKAELIHKLYTKIFPQVSKAKRKFPILVYGSKDDYHAAGGSATAGGHYDPRVRKLVLFKYEKDEDTQLVLFHEGFHQFLHDYLEQAPQWFNEGLGDFFGPSRYVPPLGASKGGMELRPNPWRLKYVQAAISHGKIRHFRELMLMSQAELYEEEWAGIHYAESWSIIYFLVKGGAPPDKDAGPYFSLLGKYFGALRAGDGQEAAYEAAFGHVNVEKLEAEWKRFTLGLKGEE